MLKTRHMNALAECFAYLLPQHLSAPAAEVVYRWTFRLFGRAHIQQASFAIRLTLAEPKRRAQEMARNCFGAKGRQRNNYRLMSKTLSWQVARTEFSPKAHKALADADKPLVMLTLHQGDYLAGLLAVLKLIPLEREIHIIKLAEWTKIEEDAYQHFRQFGHTLVIHRLSERPAKRIVRALKQRAILVTFVDVPREFGATVAVNMFDLPFHLTSGPLAMARLAGAQVLPLFSNYTANHERVVTAGPIIAPLTRDQSGAKAKRSVQSMAQSLANQIEANLRRHGEQWEMWPVIPNLLDHEKLAEDSTELSPRVLARLSALGARAVNTKPERVN